LLFFPTTADAAKSILKWFNFGEDKKIETTATLPAYFDEFNKALRDDKKYDGSKLTMDQLKMLAMGVTKVQDMKIGTRNAVLLLGHVPEDIYLIYDPQFQTVDVLLMDFSTSDKTLYTYGEALNKDSSTNPEVPAPLHGMTAPLTWDIPLSMSDFSLSPLNQKDHLQSCRENFCLPTKIRDTIYKAVGTPADVKLISQFTDNVVDINEARLIVTSLSYLSKMQSTKENVHLLRADVFDKRIYLMYYPDTKGISVLKQTGLIIDESKAYNYDELLNKYPISSLSGRLFLEKENWYSSDHPLSPLDGEDKCIDSYCFPSQLKTRVEQVVK
jgi:hypothetical protein